MAYQYSTLRFVPDPARGEFVNLGVIVGDDENQDWDFRLISNFRRAKAIDVKGVLPAALEFAGMLEAHVDAAEQLFTDQIERMSLDMLWRLSDEMRNVVQLSPPTPVVAESSDDALDLLFPELVVDPAAREFRFEKKHRALRSVRRAYQMHDVPSSAVAERARVETGPFDASFDFVVHDGIALQLVQCWSFQLPNQRDLAEQVKAWAWVVHVLRGNGGRLALDKGGVKIEPDADVEAVYVPPVDPSGSVAFEEALAAFEETGVRAVDPNRADSVAEMAVALLRGSAG